MFSLLKRSVNATLARTLYMVLSLIPDDHVFGARLVLSRL